MDIIDLNYLIVTIYWTSKGKTFYIQMFKDVGWHKNNMQKQENSMGWGCKHRDISCNCHPHILKDCMYWALLTHHILEFRSDIVLHVLCGQVCIVWDGSVWYWIVYDKLTTNNKQSYNNDIHEVVCAWQYSVFVSIFLSDYKQQIKFLALL